MKFYEIPTPDGPQFVSTKAEAQAAGVKNPEPVVIDTTDKETHRQYLNELKRAAHVKVELPEGIRNATVETFRPEGEPIRQLTAETDGLHPMSAKAILRDMDNIMKPRIAKKLFDPDDIQEIILESRGFQLNNYFGAVLEAAERARKELT